jgi:hypothetical protein
MLPANAGAARRTVDWLVLAAEEQRMPCDASDGSRNQAVLEDLFPEAKQRLWRFRPMRAFVAVAVLVTFGCATQERLRRISYDYTERTRVAAEAKASRDIQDVCFFYGAKYSWLEGPPQVVAVAGSAGRHFSATQSFTCVGTHG